MMTRSGRRFRQPEDDDYEVTGRITQICLTGWRRRVRETPRWSCLLWWKRADLDPGVHVILGVGRGEGFCAGSGLSAYAERGRRRPGRRRIPKHELNGKTQAVNHHHRTSRGTR